MFKEPLSQIVWDNKYRYRQGNKIIDQTVADTWLRVAKAIASVEKPAECEHWEKAFYQILENFQFIPGGRILAGAGTTHQVTLLNCFVMKIAEDSLSGIFAALQEGAITLQQGGGVGYDFSMLRPSGAIVHKTGLTSSGPVSFMRIWDAMCSVMQSTGARRGAMMGVLRCDHPDIEAFVAAKQTAHELRHFNVSVFVTDAFMQAVQTNQSWPLQFDGQIYRKVNARELWEKIIRSAYECAEPGVLFADTINRMNNLWYRETIHATNPCGEIPLPPYGACDLGAINLTQFVTTPFVQGAQFNWTKLEETVRVATRFLDNVIDASHYPLPAQKEYAHGARRLGLGITGLADTLIMLGERYGSTSSIQLAKQIIQRVATVTWQTSIELAIEKGPFPFYQTDYLRGEFVNTLDTSLHIELAKHGVRNSHHNTIAPTGTTSLLANNVSNGIEPVFSAEYQRHMRTACNGTTTYNVQNYAYRVWRETNANASLPPAWIDTAELTPEDHLNMQAALQPYIDNAISKTINLPVEFPFKKLSDVYTKAYQLGLKGCTIFRPNLVTGSVLEKQDNTDDHCCQHE